ncbi:MAG TPA: hypothetical protein VFV02_05050 [Acidimicrobiales bacterium]|nr:hypothetical protein [Acidimicrobiales bacterium]
MIVGVLAIVGLLMWAGTTLLIDALKEQRRGRPSLYERLAPYVPTVADEVEVWLKRQ